MITSTNTLNPFSFSTARSRSHDLQLGLLLGGGGTIRGRVVRRKDAGQGTQLFCFHLYKLLTEFAGLFK